MRCDEGKKSWSSSLAFCAPSQDCMRCLWMDNGCRCELQGAVGIPRIHLGSAQLFIHPQLAHSRLSVPCNHFSVHALLRGKNHN